MEGDEASSSTAFKVSSLSRVTSSSLDPRKHCYVLTKEVCRGYPKDFARNGIFKSFPDELRSVAPQELQPAKSRIPVSSKERQIQDMLLRPFV